MRLSGFRRYYHLPRWKAIGVLIFVFLLCRATPQSTARLLKEGRQAFREKDWAKAEALFTEAARSEPNSAVPYKWLGMAYAAQEKFVFAEPPFRRACELDPKEPDVCYYW